MDGVRGRRVQRVDCQEGHDDEEGEERGVAGHGAAELRAAALGEALLVVGLVERKGGLC